MTTTTATTTNPSASTLGDFRKSPAVWKFGAAVAILGWFLKLSAVTRRSVNGVVVDCSGVDLGPFVAGGVVALAAFAGYRQLHRRHWQLRPSRSFARAAIVVLGIAAFALVVRGVIDPDGSYC